MSVCWGFLSLLLSVGDLLGPIHTHKEELVDGLTKKYHVNQLVYVGGFDNINGMWNNWIPACAGMTRMLQLCTAMEKNTMNYGKYLIYLFI